MPDVCLLVSGPGLVWPELSLSQIGNVGPSLGPNLYRGTVFMTVVARRRRGAFVGTVYSALGNWHCRSGFCSRTTGSPVTGKIVVLVRHYTFPAMEARGAIQQAGAGASINLMPGVRNKSRRDGGFLGAALLVDCCHPLPQLRNFTPPGFPFTSAILASMFTANIFCYAILGDQRGHALGFTRDF